MINELHQLSLALEDVGIETDSWYREYKPIPKITEKSPCVRIVLLDGKVKNIELFEKIIRKYGNNQGTFPAMNLAPLYRITDEDTQKEISKLIKNKGQSIDLDEVRKWCNVNNWGPKFLKKYSICMDKIPNNILKIMEDQPYEPMIRLIGDVKFFCRAEELHKAIENKVFGFLEKNTNIALALKVLFYFGKADKGADDDYGSLSIVFDDDILENSGEQTVGVKFTKNFNRILLVANNKLDENESHIKSDIKDAFGIQYSLTEDPMPQVNLAGGFSVSLRTMFRGQPCQYRYDMIENGSYPISIIKRQRIQDALSWLSSEKMKDKTWVKTDKNEIMFIYPSKLSESNERFVNVFKRSRLSENKTSRFEDEAKKFREYISKIKLVDKSHYPDNIQIFILRKLDKARTKVVYTRCVSPNDVVKNNEIWQSASDNLPNLVVGKPRVIFPLEIPKIMNCYWKQGEIITVEKYKPIETFHGIDLLFGIPNDSISYDLHHMIRSFSGLILYVGIKYGNYQGKDGDKIIEDDIFWQLRDVVMLMGMLLYWMGFRKGDYVNTYPYLLGQMLKASDGLHALYCQVVRDGDIPPQLVGSSIYTYASENPIKAFNELNIRMKPYISWAKTYRIRKDVKNEDETKKRGLSGFYLSVLENTASSLLSVITKQDKFSDYEKAMFYIGYLSSFPKKENDVVNDNNGGENNEQ